MNKMGKINITNIISIIAICVYFILNIISTVYDLPVYASVNQRIAITVTILLCNVLIYIFTKNRIMNKIFLFYWVILLIYILGILGRLLFPYSFVFNLISRSYIKYRYFFSANRLLYILGHIRFYGLIITNDTIFLIITAVIFIVLYLLKIVRQK